MEEGTRGRGAGRTTEGARHDEQSEVVPFFDPSVGDVGVGLVEGADTLGELSDGVMDQSLDDGRQLSQWKKKVQRSEAGTRGEEGRRTLRSCSDPVPRPPCETSFAAFSTLSSAHSADPRSASLTNGVIYTRPRYTKRPNRDSVSYERGGKGSGEPHFGVVLEVDGIAFRVGLSGPVEQRMDDLIRLSGRCRRCKREKSAPELDIGRGKGNVPPRSGLCLENLRMSSSQVKAAHKRRTHKRPLLGLALLLSLRRRRTGRRGDARSKWT